MENSKGLSLVELMIVAIIIIVLTLLALPNFIAFMQRYRVVSTVQSIYYNLQYARSVAIKQATTVYISFQTGSSWCYGINTGSACVCSAPSGCNLGTFTPPSSDLTSLSLSGLSSLSFEGSRGAASSAGTITITVAGGTTSMGIDVGTVGNLQMCSNNISGYPIC